MMREAKSPSERQAAIQALSEHVPDDLKGKQLVTLSRGGINVIDLSHLPEQAVSDEVFERLRSMAVGDITMDGIINEADWQAANNIMLGIPDPLTGQPYTAEQIRRADVNGDGRVDQTDVDAIKLYVRRRTM
jgi:hypothetical protein